jgi:hypothetical protein
LWQQKLCLLFPEDKGKFGCYADGMMEEREGEKMREDQGREEGEKGQFG